MRIAIDALAMRPFRTGVVDYLNNLVTGLSEIDRSNEYLIFAHSDSLHHLAGLGRNFPVSSFPNSRALRVLWEQTMLPLELKRRRADVLHSPVFAAPWIKACPSVVTIHDLSFFLFPQYHSILKRWYFGADHSHVAKESGPGHRRFTEHKK